MDDISVVDPKQELVEVTAARTRRSMLYVNQKTKEHVLRAYPSSLFYSSDGGVLRPHNMEITADAENYRVSGVEIPLSFPKGGNLKGFFNLNSRGGEHAAFDLYSITVDGEEVITDKDTVSSSVGVVSSDTASAVTNVLTPAVSVSTEILPDVIRSWVSLPECSRATITERISLSGLYITNKLEYGKYIPHQGGRFDVACVGSGEVAFSLGEPTVLHSELLRYPLFDHKLELVDGKLLYTKYSVGDLPSTGITWPLLVDAQIFVGLTSGKGTAAGNCSTGTWDASRDATTSGWFTVGGTLIATDTFERNDYAPLYVIHRSALSFDTTSIPAGAIINTCYLVGTMRYFSFGEGVFTKHDGEIVINHGTFDGTAVLTNTFFNDWSGATLARWTHDYSEDPTSVYKSLGAGAVESDAVTRLFFRNGRDADDALPPLNNGYIADMTGALNVTYPTEVPYLEISGNFDPQSPERMWVFLGNRRRHRIRR